MNTLIIFGAKYLYLLVIMLAIVYFLKSKERRKSIATFAVIDLPLVYLTGLIARMLYGNPRPFVSEHITPLISHSANNGFPSDHVLLTAGMASVIFAYNRKIGITMFVISLLVGVSRVYAGIHHWIDIVGAMLIAIVLSYLLFKVAKKFLYI